MKSLVSSQVVIYLQDPFAAGVFRRLPDIPILPKTEVKTVYRELLSVADGDLDGDGIINIAVPEKDMSLIGVLPQDPGNPGTFLQLKNFLAPLAPVDVAIGDLNGDGTDAADVAIGDLNGDTLPDLAVASRGNTVGSVSIHIQDPVQVGKFLPGVDYQTGENSQRVKIHDFNNDALPDLAVANNDHEGGSVSVLLQHEFLPGVFLAPDNYPGLLGPADIVTEDMNGDGLADLVVADKCSYSEEGPYIRYQDSDIPGSFLPPVYLP